MQTSVLGHEGTMSVVKLEEWRERIRKELDNVVDFWLKYSHDTTHGGFFTCIGKDGKVYDELKYVWLQGRQVWMYCRLYRTMDRFHKPEILEAAKAGGAFLRKFARVSSGSSGQLKCAFCLTRDGKAVKIQRTIFSECFYVMAMDELSRVIGDKDMQLEAEQMMEQLIYWVKVDSSGLGHPQLPGDVPTNSMAVPMMLLCLVQQLTEGRGQEVVQKYSELASWCVQQILQHIQRDGTAILENVSLEGAELPGCSGRLQNPGHALEAGWFLLQLSREQEDEELQRTAINKFVELPYQCGWDKEHGGLFYFLDVDGHCPTQLEWNMKLWWPHCEALIAFLMAYNQTKKAELLERFSEVYEYTFNHALIVIIVSGIMERVSLKEKSCSEIWRGDVLLEDNGGIVEYLHDGNASDSRAELVRVYGYSDFTTRLTLERHLDAKTNPIKRKFPDAKSGEWFGYLTQEGKVALDLKGGPFKGFFHVPRCLYMCERILDDLLVNKEGGCNNGIESDLSVH